MIRTWHITNKASHARGSYPRMALNTTDRKGSIMSDAQCIEEWRDVVGYEDSYQVSSLGRVRSKTRSVPNGRGWMRPYRSRIKRLSQNRSGYCLVSLCKSGAEKTHTVHRVVAAAFINPASNLTVNHINGVKQDNRPSNLEFLTSKENTSHAIRTGLINNRGEASKNSKLKIADVRKIRELLAEKSKSPNEIARQFNVSRALIRNIHDGKTWRHVA